MKENLLISLSRNFAVDIIHICEKVKKERHCSVLTNQLLRCGTSIGANIHEGNYASSRADFINKFQIAMKECYETEYWLSILKDSEIISEDEFLVLFGSCSKIRKLLTASITTAKNNDLPNGMI
ncbi:MAG: four helix bundle protein [Acutalibacteraceae bacterium]|nr:four helix bundle protein [Acutalibacteraceae bacterium]